MSRQEVIHRRAELVVGGLKFTEGPVFHPATGKLIISDLELNTEFTWSPEAGLETLRHPSGKANGHDFDGEGRLISCEGDARRVTRLEHDGSRTVLADHFEGLPLNAPNDVVVHPRGDIYFTDPNYDRPDGADRQFVYHIRPDGGVTRAFDQSFNKPNGIGLSPDKSVLYLNVASDHQVVASRLGADGRPAEPPRRIIDGLDRGPDGMTVHARTGYIFLALFWNNRRRPDEQGINIFTPDGQYRGMVPVPGTTTNCIFAPDRDVLYITSGGGVYRIDLGPDYRGQTVEWAGPGGGEAG